MLGYQPHLTSGLPPAGFEVCRVWSKKKEERPRLDRDWGGGKCTFFSGLGPLIPVILG